jgi:hypothetical protein
MLAAFIDDDPECGAIQPACIRSETCKGRFGCGHTLVSGVAGHIAVVLSVGVEGHCSLQSRAFRLSQRRWSRWAVLRCGSTTPKPARPTTEQDTTKHRQIGIGGFGHRTPTMQSAGCAPNGARATSCCAGHSFWAKLAVIVTGQRNGVVELVQYELRPSTETVALINQADHIGNGSSCDVRLGSLG